MSRFAPNEIKITVAEDDGRLLVRLAGPAFFDALAEFKTRFLPCRQAVYRAQDKCWSMPLTARPQLEQWLTATVAPDAVQWWDEPASGRGHTYSSGRTGYAHYDHQGHERGASTAVAPALKDAFATLHLLPSAPDELVDSAYRVLARLHHPDRGGDEEQMRAVNRAVELIRREKAS